MADEVLTERRGRTLVITINRPEARNAFNTAVAQGLADAMDELDDTPELSVAIVTGAGGNFCAGMDLKAFVAGEVPTIPGRGIGFTERPPRKPVIAAVEGYALAGGTEIVLATDLVVAAKGAKFGIPEVKRGLVAAGGGLLRLPHRIPYQKALELALTGESFTAEQAAGWGFVNILTEPEKPSQARWPSPNASRPTAPWRWRRPRRSSSVRRVERGRDVAQARGTHHAGVRVQGRHGGRDGVRREARAKLDGFLTHADPAVSS